MSYIVISISVLVAFFIILYVFILSGPWPNISFFSIDFNKIRELADASIDELPTHINHIVVATGELPSWGVVAGDFGNNYPIEFPSFQLVYKDKTAIIEAPFNERLFKKFPYGKIFSQDAYEMMQNALLQAEFIIPTHEHWDHLGGIAQSENIQKLFPKLILTEKQKKGPTITDADFPEHSLDHFQAISYEKYYRVAPGVVLIDAPGHSEGHQLIFVKLQNGQEILFTGDILWVTSNLKKQKARPLIANLKRHENRKHISHQMKWLYDEFYMNKNQTIKMLTTHDPNQHTEYKEKGILKNGFQLTADFQN